MEIVAPQLLVVNGWPGCFGDNTKCITLDSLRIMSGMLEALARGYPGQPWCQCALSGQFGCFIALVIARHA